MKVDRIVARLKDKTLIKGRSVDFSPNRLFFHMTLLNKETIKVNVQNLKAAFFVKSFTGNRDYQYTYNDTLPLENNKLKVEFTDGEVMIGYADQYPFDRHGFFFTPADLDGNNERIFALTSSVKNISLI